MTVVRMIDSIDSKQGHLTSTKGDFSKKAKTLALNVSRTLASFSLRGTLENEHDLQLQIKGSGFFFVTCPKYIIAQSLTWQLREKET